MKSNGHVSDRNVLLKSNGHVSVRNMLLKWSREWQKHADEE